MFSHTISGCQWRNNKNVEEEIMLNITWKYCIKKKEEGRNERWACWEIIIIIIII